MTSVPTQPEVSVVVVSWNTRDLTLACLRSVVAAFPAGSPSVEVILVDNASSDDTVEAVTSSLAPVRVIRLDENVGFARAANRGIAETSGRLVLLVNSDADLSGDSIARLSAILDARPEAGAVGAALVGPDGELQFSCGRFLNPVNQCAESLGLSKLVHVSWLRRTYASSELRGEAVTVDWCVGACLMIRRSALDDVGVFDERFVMYSEYEELCLRRHRRVQKFRSWLKGSANEVAGKLPSTELSASDALEKAQARARVYRVLDTLKNNYRTALILFELEGRSAAEIAALCAVTPSVVWVWLHRARAEFSKRLVQLEESEGVTR